MRELAKAIDCIHAAKIVHLDLYPSNIMWRKLDDGSVAIKIIDWDSVCFKDEPILESTQDCLRDKARYDLLVDCGFKAPESTASTFWDHLVLGVLLNVVDRASLATTDKSELDQAFNDAVSECKASKDLLLPADQESAQDFVARMLAAQNPGET
eukprot:m.268436 g.268436  ORF g.268436 m.268436 type:complete len:154 (+) comp11077_c2_seq5:1178-1639(+)